MTTLLLVRHAVTDQTGKRLYGRQAGVHLSDAGRAQAGELGERLAPLPLVALYTSPLERCLETARAIASGRRLRPRVVAGLTEVDCGDWTGRTYASIRRSKAWRRFRASPSTARFPGGESLAEVQRRVVGVLERIAARHPSGAIAVVTHGDPVRLALAHYAGVHLDLFQRIEAAPASVSAVALTDGPPRILRVNETGGLADLVPARSRRVGG